MGAIWAFAVPMLVIILVCIQVIVLMLQILMHD